MPPTAEAVGFPQIPDVRYSGQMTRATVINFDVMPPVKGAGYPVFVPKTDADGRDIAGVHLPTLEAPIATHTGWNFRKAGFAEGELCENNGSMFPFPATREERLKNNDSRPSLAERYPKVGDRFQGSETARPGPTALGRGRKAVHGGRELDRGGSRLTAPGKCRLCVLAE